MDHITINNFEGPLDLLLHLIKESDVSIYDISIEEITDKYLEYIRKEKELNINVSSSYLVMASELMYIKSKSLLPNTKKEDDKEEDEELTRESLIDKLLEYKKYKEKANEFKTLEEKRMEIYTKPPENYNEYSDNGSLSNVLSSDDLVNAFKLFLERIKYQKPIETKIANKEYSVKDRKRSIRDFLRLNHSASLEELITEYTRPFIVVTFLSVLEMVKEGDVTVKQDRNFDKILIELRS